MQCASCQAVYSNALEACPRCHPATSSVAAASAHAVAAQTVTSTAETKTTPSASQSRHTRGSTPTNTTSTLIEFPGAARTQQPAWRKELSERVREIQERRAREGAHEDNSFQHASRAPIGSAHTSAATQQLGLVPPPPPAEERPLNPIVAAALARVARARRNTPQPSPAFAAPAVATAALPAPALPAAVPPPPVTDAHLNASHASAADRSLTRASIAEGRAVTPERPRRSQPDGAASNGDHSASAAPRAELKPAVALPPGVDANSPAFLKHKQEEEARNRAKMLAAKRFVPAPARTAQMTTAGGGAQRASAALAAEAPALEHHEANTAPREAKSAPPHARLAAPSSEAQPLDAPSRETPRPSAQASPRLSPAAEISSQETKQTTARRVTGEILDEAMLARREAEQAAADAARLRASPDDHAPFKTRIASGAVDAIVIAFLASPVAAALELSYGDWSGSGIKLAMTLTVFSLVFLYVAAATAFAGRTWGMSLLSLRTVDVESGMTPTTNQALRRAFACLLSMLTLGLGFLYALIDPEGRGAHDHMSGTVVVRD